MTTDKGRKHLPPYVSYRTFHNFVDRLQEQGTPQRIDRSYWSTILSGSTGPQLMAAMRFLGLVDTNGKPTERLKLLVPAEGEKRSQVIRSIATEAFSFVTKSNLDLSSATYAQLEEAFHNNFNLTDDVRRKCVKFFIAMAGDGGVPISPHIIRHTRSARNGTMARISARKTIPKVSPGQKVPQITDVPQGKKVLHVAEELPNHTTELLGRLLDKFPEFDPAWNDELKQKWLTSFDELFKKVLFNI
jgi:hypothetical protein